MINILNNNITKYGLKGNIKGLRKSIYIDVTAFINTNNVCLSKYNIFVKVASLLFETFLKYTVKRRNKIIS